MGRRELLLHSPSILSGQLGVAARSIAEAFVAAGWRVTHVAWNHPDVLDTYPEVRIVLPRRDGSLFAEDVSADEYEKGNYDACMVVADIEIGSRWANLYKLVRDRRRLARRTPTPIVFVFPVDGPVLDDSLMLKVADVSVTFSTWGVSQLGTIPPGCNIKVVPLPVADVFKPLDAKTRAHARKEVFHVYDDRFIILAVGPNTPQRDLWTTLCVQDALRGRMRSMVYVHAQSPDCGINLSSQVQSFSPPLLPKTDFLLATTGRLSVPDSALRYMYGAADCLVDTSRREGRGDAVLRAMACRCPVVGPNYGVFREHLTKRGILVDAATTVWTHGDNRGYGWLSDAAAMAQAILEFEPRRHEPWFEQMLTDAQSYAEGYAGAGARWVEMVEEACDER